MNSVNNYSMEIVTYISSILTEAQYVDADKRESFAKELELAAGEVRCMPDRRVKVGKK